MNCRYIPMCYTFMENEQLIREEENVDVTVTNDYASIMVVKNTAITSVLEFARVKLFQVGTYYNLYYRSAEGIVNCTLGMNNYAINSEVSVPKNEVHRFMICPEDALNIIVDGDILTTVNKTIIDRNKG